MYEQYYGLDRRLFLSHASASEVFVGPQTAKFLHGAQKALAAPDAAVAVIGPAGVGKTTLVNRSLQASEFDLTVIRIARLQLGHDEILEFLLEELGAADVPASTIRKIAHLKRLIAERMSSGTRVVVVIEDAVWIGDDALAELEALTAADGNDSEGANLILMGDGALKQILQSDSLARLHQRVRFYSNVKPLASKELSAYLKHVFRLAGGDFDRLFAEHAALYLHRLTGGIPRIVNNLVESVMIAGAEKRLANIDNALIARIAKDEYGLTAEFPIAATAELDADAEPAPAPAATSSADSARAANPDPDVKTEAELISESQLGVGPKFGIAGLISDTLPDLDKLAPELLDADTESSESDSEIDLANLPDSVLSRIVAGEDDIPTLYDSGRLKVAIVEQPVKDAAKIPTLQVALEAENDVDAMPPSEMPQDESLDNEIALDMTIEENIAIATAALEKHDATIAEYIHSSTAFAEYSKEAELLLQTAPDVESATPDTMPEARPDSLVLLDVESVTPTGDPAAAARHLKIAGELSAAATLDDVDDQMAESLFSTQIGNIAKRAAAAAPASAPANTTGALELTLVDDEPPVPAAARPPTGAKKDAGANATSGTRPEPPHTARPMAKAAASAPPVPPPVLAMTATQRLETVRALNAKGRPPSVPIPTTAAVGTPANQEPPRPIEDQIKTVVPRASRELGVGPHTANDEDDEEEACKAPRKTGFFSRFRRS